MTYDAQRDRFALAHSDLQRSATMFRSALRNIRKLAGLPLDRYARTGPLAPADHAQRDVIEGAEVLGIDLGGRWGNEIDLRD